MIVSVIIPTRNRHDLLRESVLSVARQTYEDVELIVVDDGSSEPVEQAARTAWSEKRPAGKLQVIRQEPLNSNIARNKGFHACKGEWVIFLDSDDLLSPDCIENRIRYLSNKNDDFVATVGQIFQSTVGDQDLVWNLSDGSAPILRFITSEPVWQTTSCLWRSESIKRLGGWLETITSLQDSEFHARMLVLGAKGDHLPVIDHFIRVADNHSCISSKWHSMETWQNALNVLESLCDSIDRSSFNTKILRKSLACFVYAICSHTFSFPLSGKLHERALVLANEHKLISLPGRWIISLHLQSRSVTVSTLLTFIHPFVFPIGIHQFSSHATKATPIELLGDDDAMHLFLQGLHEPTFFGGLERLKNRYLLESLFYLSGKHFRRAKNAFIYGIRDRIGKLRGK